MNIYINIGDDAGSRFPWNNHETASWWLDILMQVKSTESRVKFGAYNVTLNAGQIVLSATHLADKWKKSRKTMVRFVSKLEENGLISREMVNGQIPVVTILKSDESSDILCMQFGLQNHMQVHSEVHSGLHTQPICFSEGYDTSVHTWLHSGLHSGDDFEVQNEQELDNENEEVHTGLHSGLHTQQSCLSVDYDDMVHSEVHSGLHTDKKNKDKETEQEKDISPSLLSLLEKEKDKEKESDKEQKEKIDNEKEKQDPEHLKELMKKRAKAFYNSLVPFVGMYGKEMVREFYDYWTEPNKSNTKMRFELEKTWSLNLRLARWANNKKVNNNNENNGNNWSTNQQAEAEARRQDAASIIARLEEKERNNGGGVRLAEKLSRSLQS